MKNQTTPSFYCFNDKACQINAFGLREGNDFYDRNDEKWTEDRRKNEKHIIENVNISPWQRGFLRTKFEKRLKHYIHRTNSKILYDNDFLSSPDADNRQVGKGKGHYDPKSDIKEVRELTRRKPGRTTREKKPITNFTVCSVYCTNLHTIYVVIL